MTIRLTVDQEKHIESIRWLINGANRRQGKSFLLAIVFIEKAVENIGEEITVFDHFNIRQNNRSFLHLIRDVFYNLKYKNIDIEFNESRMTITAVLC